MAFFTELPVYKVGYDLLLGVYQRTATFSGEYKYTMGERLKNEVTEMLIHIYKANKSGKDMRVSYISDARKHLEIVRLLLRICRDVKVIGLKGHVSLNMKVEEVSRQLGAWHKHAAGACGNDGALRTHKPTEAQGV
jgi:hypothetical protein